MTLKYFIDCDNTRMMIVSAAYPTGYMISYLRWVYVDEVDSTLIPQQTQTYWIGLTVVRC